jgi:hypothetical protein
MAGRQFAPHPGSHGSSDLDSRYLNLSSRGHGIVKAAIIIYYLAGFVKTV